MFIRLAQTVLLGEGGRDFFHPNIIGFGIRTYLKLGDTGK
jgi:hypothetical protein